MVGFVGKMEAGGAWRVEDDRIGIGIEMNMGMST